MDQVLHDCVATLMVVDRAFAAVISLVGWSLSQLVRLEYYSSSLGHLSGPWCDNSASATGNGCGRADGGPMASTMDAPLGADEDDADGGKRRAPEVRREVYWHTWLTRP